MKINVAYSDVLVYNEKGGILYPNSNISKYDIHSWYTANFNKIEEEESKLDIKFPYTLQNNNDSINFQLLVKFGANKFDVLVNGDDKKDIFESYLLDDIYKLNQPFIYPIILSNNDLFYKYDSIELDDKVIERAREGKAKIVFIQAMEGFFGVSDTEFVWLNNLSIKYELDKHSIIMITANMKALDNYNELLQMGIIDDTFFVIPHSYFQHNLWFHKYENHNYRDVNSLYNVFNECLFKNKIIDKKKHFLCFNRVPKPHRISIFGEIQTNEKLKDKTILTLGSKSTNEYSNATFYEMVDYTINSDYIHNKDKILKFYESYNDNSHYIYDESDLHNNKASNVNIVAHKKTFVNIVTETSTFYENIFFSEKIYKPIYCAQPFILLGNPHSLRKLKEMGFKTFDKWWDESYDDEVDFTRRLEKIIDVMETISEWSLEKCKEVTLEMESVLIHNFETMVSDENLYKLYNTLKFDT